LHDGRGTENAWVHTSAGFRVFAKALVVATNTPVNDRFVIHTKQAPMRTYVVAYEVPAPELPRALLWDTGDPYHYVRWSRVRGNDSRALLIVGGEDHPTGEAHPEEAQRFQRLHTWTRERFDVVEGPRHRWSGQVLEPNDSLAFIGLNPGSERTFVATGDSGNGLTHGVIAGMLLRELVLGRAHASGPARWASLYDPSRKHVSLPELARTGVHAGAAYAHWLQPGTAASIEDVPRGEGLIVQRGLRKLAVYRRDDGTLSVCSAACTHLGGLVTWNALERSWDCPVHGSRFDVDGKVLNGPACHRLQRVVPETPARPHKLAG
jgi:nitrite reductase/ring-hydroxylating ferredoxin subunit